MIRWIVAALLILLVGLVFELGLLVFAMYALLGLVAVSQWLARQWIENLDAERESSRQTAEIGEKAAVVVKLRNRGGVPIPWVIWEDALPKDALVQRPPRLKTERRRLGVAQIGPRGEVLLLYQVRFLMRGYYQIGPLLVESGDVFGLHRRWKVLTEPQYVLVYPKVIPIRGYDITSRRPIGEVRMTHRLFEDPTRVSGVRPYQHGDPLNRIHWKATARTGELHSKTYEPSTVAGATLLLDFHTSGYTLQGEPHRSELAVTTAASLANAVSLLGQQVGLITNARDAADRIREEGHREEFVSRDTAKQEFGMAESSDRLRPVAVETRRGAEQFPRILETLARLEKTDGLTFTQLVGETSSRMPHDATVVAILPDVPEETAITLANLRRQGYAVTVLLVMYGDEDGFHDAAGRLVAQSIDFRRVDGEEALANVCSGVLVGGR